MAATQVSCNNTGEISKYIMSETAIPSGTVISFTITSASTAAAESIVCIVEGYLVPTT
jgi:hypothetical protein